MAFFYKTSRAFLKGFFTTFYHHQALQPQEGLYPGAALIAANHFSFLDPPLIAASLQEEIHFLAGRYLFKNPCFRKLIRSLNAHPVSSSPSDISTLKMVCQLLREGKKVLIFPEGTRSPDGTISTFKRGLGLLAQKANCPVIPTYIHGTYEAWPREQKLPSLLGQKTACIFGQPLFIEESSSKNAQEAFAQQVYSAILDLQKEFLQQ